jgi:bacillithiol synthase
VTRSETACFNSPEGAALRIEKLSFDQVPGQSRLFLDYLRDPQSLQQFYPSATRFHYEISNRKEEVLKNYSTNRDLLCDALERLNRSYGVSDTTLDHISQLRDSQTVAVVTGQQVGLFSGPLYTIYKALTAIKLAQCLTQRGTQAVAVFWMATEDHDWDEIASCIFLNTNSTLSKLSLPEGPKRANFPVGTLKLDSSINQVIDQLFETLPQNEFTAGTRELVESSYQPGRTLGEAFGSILTTLLGKYGLIIVDPLDSELKKLMAPAYVRAAELGPVIVESLIKRDKELAEKGYPSQILVSENSFPLFIHKEGERFPLIKSSADSYRIKSERSSEYKISEIVEMAKSSPEMITPNATLRAAVQDWLLPTIAYVGGPAEIAYSAQISEVYRVLERPVTSVLPRASLTIVDHKTATTLEKYGLKLQDFFTGKEKLYEKLIRETLSKEISSSFDNIEEELGRMLSDLGSELKDVDPTLAASLETSRRKMFYQLSRMRSRFNRAVIQKQEVANNRLERAFNNLYPDRNLQERRLNVVSLLARDGTFVIDWIYDAIDIGSKDHLVVYL